MQVVVRGPPDGAFENIGKCYSCGEHNIQNPIYLFGVVRAFVRCARFALEVALHHLRYAIFLNRAWLQLWRNARRHLKKKPTQALILHKC